MQKNNFYQPFTNIKEKFKWEKLHENIINLDYNKIKKINKQIFKKHSGKDKKKALILLLA